MYNEYFGLQEMPFSIAPDPRYLYMSEQHREALAHLVYGFNSDGGFVLLTGEVGTGKTTVCRCLLEQIPENSAIAFIINPKLTVEELLATICDEFGINYPKDNTSIKVFIDLMNVFLLDAHTNGRRAVLIIDEAQNLSADVLEQLRLLTNLETNQRKLLQIILLGQSELKDMLSQPELRQLSQRVIARYHLGPLSKKDVSAYIMHRLAIAGLQRQLFTASTIDKLYRLSGGIPRLINVLCDRSLLGAFVQGKDRVNKSTLTKAAREVFGETKVHDRQRKTASWLLPVIMLVVFGSVLAATLYNNYNDKLRDVQSVEIKALVPPKLDKLQWPVDQPIQLSNDMAYQSLFKHWGIAYLRNKDIIACQQAEKQGLRCLHGLGSLDSLSRLNRPAVLKLFDNQGRKFYATLISLTDKTATFTIGADTREVAVKDLALQWFGDYTLLWQMPPDYQGNILFGKHGAVVQWLDNQLALIQGRTARSEEALVFDEEFVKQVMEFQLSEGLIPDGIVGPQTLIHINTATDSDTPILVKKKEEQ